MRRRWMAGVDAVEKGGDMHCELGSATVHNPRASLVPSWTRRVAPQAERRAACDWTDAMHVRAPSVRAPSSRTVAELIRRVKEC